MQYVEGGDDIEIAKFNNNLFSDPYRSFGMTKYAWQIPEEYVGQKLYFVLHDEATSDTPFGVLTADEFKTDYAIGQEPVIDGKLFSLQAIARPLSSDSMKNSVSILRRKSSETVILKRAI